MSARENFVSIEGNLVSDPELRYTPTGKAVTTITIATSERRLLNGEWVDGHTSYFDAVAWERLAEHACATVGKGDRVTITGSLKQRSWEQPDGQKRYKVEIAADAVNVSLRFATATMQKASYGGMDAESVKAATVASAPAGRSFVPAGAEEEPF